MLSNKNNKINPFKSMILSPVLNYKQSWYFSIKPLYSLVMLLGIAICLVAAIWQYQKSQFYLAPVAQQVHMKGHYLNEFTHFLDNQTLHGRAGYAVITPFAYEASIYLVNRGFVSYESRDFLPRVTPVTQTVTLSGLLLNNNIPMLLNSRLIDPLSKRIQYINNKYYSQLVGQAVVKDIFHLKQGAGLQTLMPVKAPYLNHHRHQGYALQWLLLAIAGLIILVVASIKTRLKISSPSGEKL
ncbi:hypothetical protein A9Q73_04475 [Bermanella sp. 47_1433_sub80_T6]|nr:hypothetical protein A9Q73_04475 [Bermanella sp. 47_1433_sub80_T6]